MSAYLILATLAAAFPTAVALLLPWPGLSNLRLFMLRVLAVPLIFLRRVPAWAWSLAFLLVAGLALARGAELG